MVSFTVELWTEYGIGVRVLFLRFFARSKVVGLQGLAWDDLFAFIALPLWTVDGATVQIISTYGSFIGLNAETTAALSDERVKRYEVGSKALFVAWISYVTLIWSLKASLLFFYRRLILGLWQQKFVKIMAVASVLAYLAVILTLFLHCTPIEKNWQVRPYAGDKCTVTVANYIIVAALNVIIDAGILAIPIPLIWAVKIPLRRKLIIGLLLSSGIFVITAALLRCVLTLAAVGNIGNSTIWGVRETFVSLIAINAPAIKPLFRKNRWIGSSVQKGASSGADGRGGFSRFGRKESVVEITDNTANPNSGLHNRDLEAGRSGKGTESVLSALSDVELKDLSRTGSQENIIDKCVHTPENVHPGNLVPLHVNVTTVYALADGRSAEIEQERRLSGNGNGNGNGTNRIVDVSTNASPTFQQEREESL